MTAAAGLLAAATLGVMLFFACVVAPTIFKTLPEQMAGSLIRRLFPHYYLVLAVITGLAAMLALGTLNAAAALALVCGVFLAGRFVLMPRINQARDASLAGDRAAATTFRRLHGASVILNAIQMLVLAAVAVRLA